MKIVCISDTHGQHRDVNMPEGDILIHAGDICKFSTDTSVYIDFKNWLGELPYEHKYIIAGNHDQLFQKKPDFVKNVLVNCTYLQDSGEYIPGTNTYIYGSPWQPWFFDWAFNFPKEETDHPQWDLIPDHTNILVTHGPPYYILDTTPKGQHVGCDDLRWHMANRLKDLKLSVFGHVHPAAGTSKLGEVMFINASVVDETYTLANKPQVIDYESI